MEVSIRRPEAYIQHDKLGSSHGRLSRCSSSKRRKGKLPQILCAWPRSLHVIFQVGRHTVLPITKADLIRPPANKPKPNTRFLRNIIKDTDSHNAALLAKEAAESKARLLSLSSNEYREVKANHIGGGDIRKRQLGDIASILGGRQSKRAKPDIPRRDLKETRHDNGTRHADSKRADISSEDDEPAPLIHDDKSRTRRQLGNIAAILGDQPSKRKRSDDHELKKRTRHSDSASDKDEPDSRDSKSRKFSIRGSAEKSRNYRSRYDDEGRKSYQNDRSRRRAGSEDRERDGERKRRHRDRSKERERDDRKRHRSRSRSRSPRKHRSRGSNRRDRSPIRDRKDSRSLEPDRDRTHRSHRRRPSSSSMSMDDPQTSKKNASKDDYDSDPLDDIIGPRPPPVVQVRPRGRGAISHISGIDSRFSASYDPSADVALDPEEENDWDQALEALRDRQKWKQSGADRLKAAGFTDEEIAKWDKGGEKREEDVKWSKQGEGREWDRGKVMDSLTGTVSVEPEWGRLKGT